MRPAHSYTWSPRPYGTPGRNRVRYEARKTPVHRTFERATVRDGVFRTRTFELISSFRQRTPFLDIQPRLGCTATDTSRRSSFRVLLLIRCKPFLWLARTRNNKPTPLVAREFCSRRKLPERHISRIRYARAVHVESNVGSFPPSKKLSGFYHAASNAVVGLNLIQYYHE